MVRAEYGAAIFGVAMILETYFGVSYRPMSLPILESHILGVRLGYTLGAIGLVVTLVLLLMRAARR